MYMPHLLKQLFGSRVGQDRCDNFRIARDCFEQILDLNIGLEWRLLRELESMSDDIDKELASGVRQHVDL